MIMAVSAAPARYNMPLPVLRYVARYRTFTDFRRNMYGWSRPGPMMLSGPPSVIADGRYQMTMFDRRYT